VIDDHLVHAAPDLDAAVNEVEERFGVRAEGGGQHLGLSAPAGLVLESLRVEHPDPALITCGAVPLLSSPPSPDKSSDK
jgi:hypothetical protein